MSFIDFALSSMMRRKAKNVSLLIAYTGVVFGLASTLFFTTAMKREASLILQGAPEMVVQRVRAGRQDLISLKQARIIGAIRGVASVEGRLWGYYYDRTAEANYTFMVPRENPPVRGCVIIGKGISRQREAHDGDKLSFWGHDGLVRSFVVRGTLSPESELVSVDLLLISEGDFRDFFGVSRPYVTDLAVTVKNPLELPTIAHKVSDLLPETRPIIRDDMAKTYDAVFDWREGIVLLFLVSSLAAFTILAWEKASGISADEKREIGILKAIGWETSEIISVKLWEALSISLVAFLLGIIFAFVHVFLGSAFLLAPVLKGWSTLYPHFRLVPFVDAYQVTVLFFLSVVPYILATMAPSWRAATVDPDTIMRGVW